MPFALSTARWHPLLNKGLSSTCPQLLRRNDDKMKENFNFNFIAEIEKCVVVILWRFLLHDNVSFYIVCATLFKSNRNAYCIVIFFRLNLIDRIIVWYNFIYKNNNNNK